MSQSKTRTGAEMREGTPYHPQKWKCIGSVSDEEYAYYDGDADSADHRCIIDLATDSMERLRDVRPIFYHFGFWSDPDPFLPKGDEENIETHYVRAGRAYLLSEMNEGRGYFAGHRDWEAMSVVNRCASWAICVYDPIPSDVGCGDGTVWDPEVIAAGELRNVFKTNMRVPLFHKELLTDFTNDHWDAFVKGHYSNHPIYRMNNLGYSLQLWQYEKARWLQSESYLKKEAIYVYTNPHKPFPPSMTPARAREFMAQYDSGGDSGEDRDVYDDVSSDED